MVSNTAANLTTQQISALRKYDRQVLNFQRIKEANQQSCGEGYSFRAALSTSKISVLSGYTLKK